MKKRRSASVRNPLEQKTRRRSRRGSVERAVIGALAIGGLLTVTAVAPKMLRLLKQEHMDAVLPRDPDQRLRETLSRMKKKGLLFFEERGGKRYPVLTEKGRARAQQVSWGDAAIAAPRRWDGRWRIVIFDIPHARRKARDRIRGILKSLGFCYLQNSVWVHPFDCEELIALLKFDTRLRSEVRYIIADAIEYDLPLRKHFGLPLS